MKARTARTSALASSIVASGALSLAVGCGSPDAAEATPASDSEPADSNIQRAPAGQPIAAADAPNISDVAEADIADLMPYFGNPSTRLVDKANPILCNVAFNTEISLLIMPDQAWHTFAVSPFYIQNCGDDTHWVYTRPINMDHYHLGYEFNSAYEFCAPNPPQVGMMIGTQCLYQRPASQWPRNASNMQSGSGIEFYARTYSSSTRKLFDLKSLRILSGPAIIRVYRTDISGWWRWELPAGTWTFPLNSTKLRYLQVLHRDFDGVFTIDDVKLDVHRQ